MTFKKHKHNWVIMMDLDDVKPQICIDGTKKLKCSICGVESSENEVQEGFYDD